MTFKKQLLTLGLLFGMPLSLLTTTPVTQAAVLGDNYPSQWRLSQGVDTWGMYTRQCTSFVAFRLSSANGFALPRGYGNADTWGHIARQQGYRVDHQPTVGSVAWFDKGINFSDYNYGHVAWVAEVNGDSVTLEEYNYNAGQGPYKYHRRQIHKHHASGFIHFKDLKDSHGMTTTVDTRTDLAPRGVYYFTERSAVRPQPNVNTQELAYYDKGQSVFYDSVLTADGYQWLSYIGASGNRRYVAIKKLNAPKQPHQSELNPADFKVGDLVSFPGVFKISSVNGIFVTSADLSGDNPGPLNYLDPTPVNETDQEGHFFGDQLLHVGEYITIPGKFTILAVDKATSGIQVKIGNRNTWVTMQRAQRE
ncbi:MAG: amidase [Streptococcus pyogenes]|nr:MAG: amidase [Streptococcus pyogenes]